MAKKPGKYAGVIDNLDALPVENQQYQDKIDTIKAELRPSLSTTELLAKEYAAVRESKEELKDQLSIIQERLTAIEQILYESFDQGEDGWGDFGAGENTLRMKFGGSVSVQLEPVGKVLDKEAFRLWCIANGLENSLQLWPSTMNAIAKERCVKGEPNPDGIKVFFQPKIVWRKG
jgi:hypothetical protein